MGDQRQGASLGNSLALRIFCLDKAKLIALASPAEPHDHGFGRLCGLTSLGMHLPACLLLHEPCGNPPLACRFLPWGL